MQPQLEVHLHTNYSCNLRCGHCYNNSGGRNQEALPQQLVMGIITAFCAAYDVEFHLEGGEIWIHFLTTSFSGSPLQPMGRFSLRAQGHSLC